MNEKKEDMKNYRSKKIYRIMCVCERERETETET